MIKRYTELLHYRGNADISRRGYLYADHIPIAIIGITSSVVAVLILALYLNSQRVNLLYSHSERLWLATPILLFWISRMWLLAHRDEVHEDPVVFTLKDKVGWWTLVCLLISLALAI